jgi:hypothetical protein
MSPVERQTDVLVLIFLYFEKYISTILCPESIYPVYLVLSAGVQINSMLKKFGFC